MANTYTITGATGNIGHLICQKLLAEGHTIRAIARTDKKLQALADKGAEIYTGSLEDTAFLINTYQGADALFAMTPPNFVSTDYRAFQNKLAQSHVAAVKDAGVKNVVALSSIGAHLLEGAGVVQGLHDFEKHLSELKNVNVLVLRPAYFMENIFMQIDVIKHMGICGTPIAPDVSQPMVATKDIADVAAEHLSNLDFKGHTIEYILGERNLSYPEVTRALGKALGKEDLQYVQFPYKDAHSSMVETGFSDNVADLLIELNKAINNGNIFSHYQRTPDNTTETSIEEFAVTFAAAFKAQQ
jgi:uncharacterized protein YbjT (DUF2867 family)